MLALPTLDKNAQRNFSRSRLFTPFLKSISKHHIIFEKLHKLVILPSDNFAHNEINELNNAQK